MCNCIMCGEEVLPKKRAELGYRVCLWCGDDVAKQERASWCVAPMNKSNYILITNPETLKQLNPKRTT